MTLEISLRCFFVSGYRCMVLILAFYASMSSTIVESAPTSASVSKEIYNYHTALDDSAWRSVTPYLLPFDHPLRSKLDKIFSKTRALAGMRALTKAGFARTTPQKWTRLIVTRHRKIPGYIFKLYLDSQHYHRKKPEYELWIARCEGASLIRQEIKANHLGSEFKVPRKWIYPLPPKPAPAKDEEAPKYFILVEEDMDIEPTQANYDLWKSPFITKKKLDAFFYILAKLGLWDCAKPDNAPISRDRKIAFVDTQTYYEWPVKFSKLETYLSEEILPYWLELQLKYKEAKILPSLN